LQGAACRRGSFVCCRRRGLRGHANRGAGKELMQRLMCLMLGLVLPAVYQEPPGKEDRRTDPVEILKRADAATRAVESVKYTAVHKGLRSAESEMPVVEGTVILSGWSERAVAKWYADVKVTYADTGKVEELSGGSDGKKFFFIDKAAKKAYEADTADVSGSRRRWVEVLIINEYVHAAPFTDEIAAERTELIGVAKVGEEECYEVHVKYKGTKQEARWFFSTKDFLPRRVDRYFTGLATGRGGRQFVVLSLEPNPKLSEGTFRLALPEGFTKVDGKGP